MEKKKILKKETKSLENTMRLKTIRNDKENLTDAGLKMDNIEHGKKKTETGLKSIMSLEGTIGRMT